MKCPNCASEEVYFEGRDEHRRKCKVGTEAWYYVNACHHCGYEEPVKEGKA